MNIILISVCLYALIIMAGRYDFNANNCDYLILLGCKLNSDKETFTMINRVNRASLYLNRNPECKVVVSGGITGNNTVSEASVMRMLLIERNIDVDRIIMEDKALNTMENMKFSKELVETDKKIAACSSDYHMLRVRLLAKKYGYQVHSIFAPTMIFELVYKLLLEEYLIIRDVIISR